MKVFKLEVGSLGTNCYIVVCEATKETFVVDPGGSVTEILRILKQNQLNLKFIVNTHGHADHIMGNAELQQATGVPLYIHEKDAPMLTSAQANLSAFMGAGFTANKADGFLKDGDTISVGSLQFTVRHTPGHTPGGICLINDEAAITGDTLFAESIGRTDFPGGSYAELLKSIREKLMPLADEVKVMPGHGPDSTIGWEKRMNPFLQ